MAKTIITLGREYCTGGRYIAKDVARALGIKLYDLSLIHIFPLVMPPLMPALWLVAVTTESPFIRKASLASEPFRSAKPKPDVYKRQDEGRGVEAEDDVVGLRDEVLEIVGLAGLDIAVVESVL